MCEKSGSTHTAYIYVNGRMVAKQTGSDTYYYIKDALGSTRQVWKHGATSTTFSVATYAPFGTPVTPSGTEKFKYAGEMLVGAAGTSPGIYYIGARWMDPELGRFVSLDPELGSLSMPQSMNRYVYCVNNPLRFVDPTGKFLNIVAAALGAAIGFVASTVLYAAEVALTDKEWDWEEYAVEAIAGTVAGAVSGFLMNPGVGLAAKAGIKAALKGTEIAAKAGLKISGKTIERVVAGSLAGMGSGPTNYFAKGGLNIARGVDPQLSWGDIGKSILLGGLGGGAGSYVGGKVGDKLGKYIDMATAAPV